MKKSTSKHGMGVIWRSWKGSRYSLKSVEMMVTTVDEGAKPDEEDKEKKTGKEGNDQMTPFSRYWK